MGFFSKLFGSTTTVIDSHKPIGFGYSSEAFDFEDEYEKEINRWRNKIDNAEVLGHEYENPDKQVAAFEKAISLCDEFRDFCYSCPGGMEYYDDKEADIKDRLEQNMWDYINNEYDSVKAVFDEEQKKKRFFSSAKRKILKSVSASDNGMTRKDIYALFIPNDQPIVLKALNMLISEGKIKKEKQGDKLFFKAK